jgi:hypothetical protein
MADTTDDLEPIAVAGPPETLRSSTVGWVVVISVVIAAASMIAAATAYVAMRRLEDRVSAVERSLDRQVDSRTVTSLDRQTRRLNERLTDVETRSVRVPDVVGLRIGEALNWVGVAGFQAGAGAPTGGLDVDASCIVVSQVPPAGERVQVVTPVRLTLGPPPGRPSLNCS